MLTFLSSLPLVGGVFGSLIGKSRLLIEYALIAVLIAVVAVSGILWLEKEQAKKKIDSLNAEVSAVNAEVAVVRTVNETQDETITSLSKARAQDDRSIHELSEAYTKLNKVADVQQAKIKKLERSDVKVKAYMDMPIPDNLKCLLTDTCADGNNNPDKILPPKTK